MDTSKSQPKTPGAALKPTVQFLQEQDGKPEQVLKGKLVEFFKPGVEVRRAYLARIKFNESFSVALCLTTIHGPDPNLIQAVSAIFKTIFVKQEHLDVMFLKDNQESELRKVCPPFYMTSIPI